MLQFKPDNQGVYPFLQLGFRPFFLLALSGAVVLGVLWSAIYSFTLPLLRPDYSFISWHAHEMIFAYAFAVVSGFLLTAVRNWTQIQTVNGWSLLLLAIFWCVGRVLPFIPSVPLWYLAVHDLLFMALILFFAALPVFRKKQWQQLVIFGLLGMMMLANLLFHLGLMKVGGLNTQIGLYFGLYIFVALILTMGRRVIPGFIENAIGGGFQARNNVWLDWFSRAVFAVFLLAELIVLYNGNATAVFIGAVAALLLFALHLSRLSGWHHRALWLHPLLWSLYIAYAWIAFGFLLKFLTMALGLNNPWAAVHAFTYGGIGLITAGMMARLILGHTGRNVFAPPPSLGIWFGLLVAGAFVRVVLVLLWPAEYQVWILASQLLWLAGFAGLLVIFTPMLFKARVDGRYG